MAAVTDAIGGFLSRNRRKFYWVGGTVGSGYMLVKYAQWKWREFQQRREVEQTAKANVKRRFEQNLQDCTFAVGSLLPTLGENLFDALNVELLTAQLQQSRQAKTEEEGTKEDSGQSATSSGPPKKTKLELWDELKILGFTRTISSVYLITLLITFTHLQLNLLGRFFYLDSVIAFKQVDHEQEIRGQIGGGPTESRNGVSYETERKYLTFSWYVLNVGWKACVERVRKATEEVLGDVSLKEQTSYGSLIETVSKIRAIVEDESQPSMTSYLLPQEGNEEQVLSAGGVDTVVDPELRSLLDETRDFLESSDFQKVVSSCFDEAFDILFKQIRPHFISEHDMHITRSATVVEVPETTAEETTTSMSITADETEVISKSIPLAGVIPVFSRLVHNVVNGVPNVFLEILSSQPELKALSVIMYTGWEDGSM
ncbi:Peroxin-3 [Phlyctochytrium arcticum]|nr:Peroxin-3 [Phlyctochytrium arcticum]